MKAVVLAGGSGTRLWPLSTNQMPKQFQKLISDKTMIEETIDRLDFLNKNDIYIAINKKHEKLVKKLCPTIPTKNIIIEPALRDTSSCIGLATSIIEKRHPEEIVSIIYADHKIENKKEFQEKLRKAEELSKKYNTINIIEVEADSPNTNYGYVETNGKFEIEKEKNILNLKQFTEKPNLELAKKFIKDGNYLWNTGIYVWKAKRLMNEYKKLQPKTYKKLKEIQEKIDTADEEKTINKIYPTLEKISIDYAIIEKVKPETIKIIKANLKWSDVGTWESIWEETKKNNENNVIKGKTELIDCKNSIIHNSTSKKISIIGLNDIIVVNTKSGLIICKKGKSSQIKQLSKD